MRRRLFSSAMMLAIKFLCSGCSTSRLASAKEYLSHGRSDGQCVRSLQGRLMANRRGIESKAGGGEGTTICSRCPCVSCKESVERESLFIVGLFLRLFADASMPCRLAFV